MSSRHRQTAREALNLAAVMDRTKGAFLYEFSVGSSQADRTDEPARARKRRGQTSNPRRRHIPERRGDRTPRRGATEKTTSGNCNSDKCRWKDSALIMKITQSIVACFLS